MGIPVAGSGLQEESDLLAESAYYDTRDICESIGRKFVDADIPQYKDHGVDLYTGAVYYLKQYTGNSNFIASVKNQLHRKGSITQPQARAVLNVMRQEFGTNTTETSSQSGDQSDQSDKLDCLVCHEKFTTWEELNAHKSQQHGSLPRAEPVSETSDPAKRVIEKTDATLGLDLSNLPDGRYAAPDPSGKNDYVFLMVKRVRRTHNRDRRYIYGKIVTGNEVVVAGTIEVKIWSSDSKELIGEQKPGEVYRGKYEYELQLIMMMPEPWAVLFGKLLHHCCICGKTLTDDDSRAIGKGLECEKKTAYFKQPPKYSFIGADRPDKHKQDPNDEKYLSGMWRRYRPFKPPAPDPSEPNITDEDDHD